MEQKKWSIDREKWAAELSSANTELAHLNRERKRYEAELVVANQELALQAEEKGKRATELVLATIELNFQTSEKGKRAEELVIANKELVYQTEEKGKRATELIIANIALAIENEKREKRAAELVIANRELLYQNEEKEKHAVKLINANKELAFQNEEKEKREAELIAANKELAKQALELIVVNNKLVFQNTEKEKRAAELIIANEELAFQNKEKEKRATELVTANKELVYQSEEKGKRATELIVANIELAFQNDEKGKRATESIIASREMVFQNVEKENRAAELIIANTELAFQNKEKEKRAAELVIANQELIKAEEQFRLVVESAPNSMVLINDEGLITLVNGETEKLFGYQRSELIGNKLAKIIPNSVNSSSLPQTSMDPLTSKADDHNLFAIRKNGTEIHIEVGLNPIETSKGNMVLVSIVDVTERKIQEAVLKEHNTELGQIVFIASHDLQEPLRTVSNYMKAFEEEYAHLFDDNAHKYIDSVNSAIKRMSLLIKSLLDFSKVGYNRKLSFVNCRQVVDEVIADLGTMIKSSNAKIVVTELPSLNLYETEIRQLFQNLIINAIKFRKPDVAPHILISAEQINDKWKFSVSDKGIGISSAYFEKVFEIFQRLHAKHEYEGSGIGLANCKKIVQLHLGEIWIESIEGEGSTFYFTIANLIL